MFSLIHNRDKKIMKRVDFQKACKKDKKTEGERNQVITESGGTDPCHESLEQSRFEGYGVN